MSYDLTFLLKDSASPSDAEDVEDGEGWDDDDDDEALEAPDGVAWERIVEESRSVLGDVDVRRHDGYFELDHEPTGIQVSLYADEAGVTVPYWYSGAEAEAIVRVMYQIGEIVERCTGMAGRDEQVGLPVADAAGRQQLAVSVFNHVSGTVVQPRAEE
ncbi:hypothetical protein AB0J72_52725 [Dactylosporangium sp. NPDC049742]|uniref:hypothetical protein n=1 Tax=Dactylosporangium sp. NPDC049742 TaxID=3154737 RepID=UPI0034421707